MPSSKDAKSTFMIEMSEHLRHIIMKRNYLLRSAKSRALLCREQIAGKSWLEVSLLEKPKADVLAWDCAHQLADKFKVELKADVFVEPAPEAGRYLQLTAPANSAGSNSGFDESNGRSRANGISAFDFDPMAAMGLSGGGRQKQRGYGSHFGIGGMGVPGMPGISGMPNIPGMPNLGCMQSGDFLPAHVREALSFGEKSSEIVLPALRELPAFSELPEATKNMFEVEAVQVLHSLVAQVGASEHNEQSLAALMKLPNISKRLKLFLAKALLVEA